MADARSARTVARIPRHERPAVDEAAMVAARHADRLLVAARVAGASRWVAYFDPMPDRLRDDDLVALRATTVRCRAAFGVKDSIRDAVAASATEPFLDAIDRLTRELNRSTE